MCKPDYLAYFNQFLDGVFALLKTERLLDESRKLLSSLHLVFKQCKESGAVYTQQHVRGQGCHGRAGSGRFGVEEVVLAENLSVLQDLYDSTILLFKTLHIVNYLLAVRPGKVLFVESLVV